MKGSAMKYFDYRSTARTNGVPDETLARWEAIFREEYPGDGMMVELRLLRACDAVGKVDGGLKEVDEALTAEGRSISSM